MEICQSSWDLYWDEYEERKARQEEEEEDKQEEQDWVYEAIKKEQNKNK